MAKWQTPLMSSRRRIEIDRAQRERDRHHDGAVDGESPEHVDIGEQVDLVLQRLSTAREAFDPFLTLQREKVSRKPL